MAPILEEMRSTLDPTLDVVFKMLFANPRSKDCLIALLNAVLKPQSPIVEVTVLNPNIPKQDVRDKGIVLDVLVELGDGTKLDVEMQSQRKGAFRKRVIFYWARRYCSQLEPGAEYQALRPTIVIVFTKYKELGEPEAKHLHSVFRILETRHHFPFHRDLEIHMIELPKLSGMSDDERDDEQALVRWATFLAAETDTEVESAAKEDTMIEKAKDILEFLSREPDARELARLRQEAQVWYRMDLEEERKLGREEGIKEGIIEGEARGETKGKIAAKREMLLMLLDRQGIALDEEQRRQIDSCDDAARLDEWIRAALTAQSSAEVFD